MSLKTIRLDLEALQQVGIPLEEQSGEFGRKQWRIDAKNAVPQMSFALDEALALYLGRRFLEPLSGTMIEEAAQRAFAKIRASLGKNVLRYLDQMAGIPRS